jgi:hypothetical protein
MLALHSSKDNISVSLKGNPRSIRSHQTQLSNSSQSLNPTSLSTTPASSYTKSSLYHSLRIKTISLDSTGFKMDNVSILLSFIILLLMSSQQAVPPQRKSPFQRFDDFMFTPVQLENAIVTSMVGLFLGYTIGLVHGTWGIRLELLSMLCSLPPRFCRWRIMKLFKLLIDHV